MEGRQAGREGEREDRDGIWKTVLHHLGLQGHVTAARKTLLLRLHFNQIKPLPYFHAVWQSYHTSVLRRSRHVFLISSDIQYMHVFCANRVGPLDGGRTLQTRHVYWLVCGAKQMPLSGQRADSGIKAHGLSRMRSSPRSVSHLHKHTHTHTALLHMCFCDHGVPGSTCASGLPS